VKHRYAREVNRHQDLPSHKTKIDADIRYFKSQSRALTSRNRNRSHRVRVKFTRRPMVGAQGV
jgi:hypothetical protein